MTEYYHSQGCRRNRVRAAAGNPAWAFGLRLDTSAQRHDIVENEFDIGRVVLRVADMLRWFPPGRCAVIFHDGRVVRTREWQENWLDASASLIEAVEYYRLGYHAPRAYRSEAHSNCSILALWSRRTPSNTTRPLRLAGASLASLLLVLLLR